jgi:hypothetical protein
LVWQNNLYFANVFCAVGRCVCSLLTSGRIVVDSPNETSENLDQNYCGVGFDFIKSGFLEVT